MLGLVQNSSIPDHHLGRGRSDRRGQTYMGGCKENLRVLFCVFMIRIAGYGGIGGGFATFGNKAALVSKAVYFRCKLGRSSGSVE